ncbi:kinase-like domain-containing protein [Paraphoma chrysanthemicola]|uniref:Kinase-like domain-containing protein n=1 Tax=Paraphoma chrysanthemicola TaxID=798071 RepID=A0A8K0W471_9PLEO|nr:kinase-like domain-containing protein [Paraphoma chrysanthemicola]
MHIAKIFCGFTFTKNGAYYLVSAPADCDLEDFMQQNPSNPRPDHVNFTWLLAQFRGLANALHAIHTGIPGKFVAHRDIKPANILVFTDPNSSTRDKVLKVSDWGSAISDLHEPNTEPGSPRSCTHVGPPYYAPECRNDGMSSRKHDVWSLGCVLLEVLIWWLKGWEYLVEWRVRRNEGNEEGFWKDGKDELLDQVEDELEWLQKNGFPNTRRVVAEMQRFEEGKRLTAEEVARRI